MFVNSCKLPDQQRLKKAEKKHKELANHSNNSIHRIKLGTKVIYYGFRLSNQQSNHIKISIIEMDEKKFT